MQEKIFFNLYKFLTSKEILFVRIILFALLTLFLLLFFDNYEFLISISPFYFLLFLQELFIHIKLERYFPKKDIGSASFLKDAAFFNVRADIESSHSTFEIIKSIASTKKGKFLIEKINPTLKINENNIDKSRLLEKAGIYVKALGGKYISNLDMLAAYIFFQEESLKTLQNESLSERDLIIILYWARKKFEIEFENSSKLTFSGQGVFDWLVYGWTPQTNNITSDFTSEVLKLGYKPNIIGREKEYREIIEGLSKSSSKNILLVGDPGVGKTNLVMRFAYDAYKGFLTKGLKSKRVYFLFIDKLISGAENKGDLEARIGDIFTEISHSGNIIVFIENIENIMGGGGFDFDISGAMQPYLEGSNVQIIGTTNIQAYKDFIQSKPSITPLFNEVNINEAPKEVAIFMLIEEVNIREKLSSIHITYGAIREIVEHADIYSTEMCLPGSAVKFLEDVIVRNVQSGKSTIEDEDIKKILNEKRGINVSDPSKEEKQILLNMESTLGKGIIGQENAINAVSNAIRRLRSGLKDNQGPIASFLFLGPTGVGKTTMAKLLSKEYYGNEDKMIRLDMSEFQTQDSIKKLLGELPGEESFKTTFLDQVEENPSAVILLDEFEKAHPRLLDVFLQILDEGFVTTNKGKKTSFANSIIIATSNAGSEFIREHQKDNSVKDKLVDYILTKGIFRPELVNRFSDIVIFESLSDDEILQISKVRLNELTQRLESQFLYVTFSENAIEKVARESFSADFGARNVRRYIEEKIENLISRYILEEKIQKGDSFTVSISDDNNFIIEGK